MDWAYMALITVVAALLLMMVQRAEAKRRRMVAGLVFLALLLIRQNAFIKGDLHEETLLAIGLGLVINAMFWLLVGRYNPVGSSDDIQVMGLDD